MSTDATERPAQLIVTDAPVTTVPPRARPRAAPLRWPVVRHPRWRDPDAPDILAPSAVAAAGSTALAGIVVLCLLLVSLAAARPGILLPSTLTRNGYLPGWLAGPTGALTSWFVADAHVERVVLTLALAAMLVAYLVAVCAAGRVRPALVIGSIVAVHAVFLLSPPIDLTDIFNYLNYGRMEHLYHLNPYTTIPALEPHSDPTFLLSNWHGLLSPYGPLFTLYTMGLAGLGVAGSFWAMKVTLMLASLSTVFLVYRCALMLGRNALSAAVVMGMNPIVLVWGLGGDHNDFLMLFFIVLAFWLLLRADALRVGRWAPPAAPRRGVWGALGRGWAWLDGMARPLVDGEPAAWMEVGAGVSLVAAVAIKASSAVLIPVVLLGAARRVRLATGLVIGLAAATAMTVYTFGVNLPNLGQQDRLTNPNGIPNLTGLALGFGGETSQLRNVLTVLLIAVIVGCALWAGHARRWLTASGWVTFALIVTLSWTLPWYIAWLLPFVALSRSRGLRLAAMLLGLYIYLAWMPYASEILSFLHINAAQTALGQQEQSFMNSLLF